MARFFFRPFQWLRPKRRPVATLTVAVAGPVAATGVATAWTSAVGLLTAVAASQGVAVATTSPVGALTATAQATGVATVWTQPSGRLQETGAKGVATVWTHGVGVLNATAQATGVGQVWTAPAGSLSIFVPSTGNTPTTLLAGAALFARTVDTLALPSDQLAGAITSTVIDSSTETSDMYTRTSDRMDLKVGDVLDRPLKFDVRQFAYASVEISLIAGSWAGAIITIKRSNDDKTFGGLETAQTFSAAAQGNQIDVRGVAFLVAEVTTHQGGSATVEVAWYGSNFER